MAKILSRWPYLISISVNRMIVHIPKWTRFPIKLFSRAENDSLSYFTMIIDSGSGGKSVLCVNWVSHGTQAHALDAIYGKCVSPYLLIVPSQLALYTKQITFSHSFGIDSVAFFKVCIVQNIYGITLWNCFWTTNGRWIPLTTSQ